MVGEDNIRQRRNIDETPLYPPETNVPDELFEVLKKCILDYHPSTDLTLIEKAYRVADGKEFDLTLGKLTDDEREIILDGCLINYYRNH